jgi:hypothetical protein
VESNWVHSALRPLIGRPIVPAPGDYDDGDIGGMMIGRGNRSTWRKPAPVPLCPPQTPHAARMRTQAAAVGSQQLTAWVMARPYHVLAVTIIHVNTNGEVTGSEYGEVCWMGKCGQHGISVCGLSMVWFHFSFFLVLGTLRLSVWLHIIIIIIIIIIGLFLYSTLLSDTNMINNFSGALHLFEA